MKDLLRAKGDNKHNKQVNDLKKGELILFRRPTEIFCHEDYGPCSVCLEWMLTKSLPKHLKTCKGDTESCLPRKRYMKTMSDVAKGKTVGHASQTLVEEVFTIMKSDNVGVVAKSDELIISVGEKWMKSCIDNKVKRKYWSSQHMRLSAKLLIEVRNLEDWSENDQTGKSMWDYLRPAYFENLAQGALNIALPDIDDVEELKSPSNAIKIKYDLITMLERKSCKSLQMYDKTGDKQWKKYRKEAEGVITDVNRLWKIKVTKLARKVLLERRLTRKEQPPLPKDNEKLGECLKEQLTNADLDKNDITWPYFKEMAQYGQARLLSYNKRRSGEIENITLKNYRHKLNMDDLDEGLIGEITEMDRYLMKSHDLIQTRGKKGGIVPVLIPPECKRVLEFLADAEVREKVTVNGRNAYLFPQRFDTGPVRAYDSLSHVCAQFNLTKPEQITSTSLRKYMATLAQVLNLAPNELQWVCRHLGHTEKVHLSHYRTMSPFIERVNVGKILLMQDMNMQDKFVGKKLEEIDFFDIIRDDEGNRNTGETGVTGPTPEETEATGSTQVTVATGATGATGLISEDVTGSDPGSDPDYADCNDMAGESDSGKVKQTKKKQTKKQ